MQEQKTIIIEKNQANERLDKFLAVFYPEKSRSSWQKSLKNKEILINGKAAKPNCILKEGDKMEILAPEITKEKPGKMEMPAIKIVYENFDVIVLNKPGGILSHSAASNEKPSVVDFLLNYLPPIKNVGEDKSRPGIVHRLDKDTSGIMIAAKNNLSFSFLKKQFENREVVKIYTALVHGHVKPSEGSIDFNIRRSKTRPTTQVAVDTKKNPDSKSRAALTFYKAIKFYDDYTLLEVRPKTGRMHQIRVHLKAIGHPIAGDKKYFFKKYRQENSKLSRQFLHAGELRIKLPDGKEKIFRSPLPEDLKKFLDSLPNV